MAQMMRNLLTAAAFSNDAAASFMVPVLRKKPGARWLSG